jgi:hypothetical protein
MQVNKYSIEKYSPKQNIYQKTEEDEEVDGI